MYCKSCGNNCNENAIACTSCGIPPKKGKSFCGECGEITNENAIMCIKCGNSISGKKIKEAKKVDILTLSMGSGSDCDGQYLFGNDVLGYTEGRMPRHARVYRDFKKEYQKLQEERVRAFKEFHDDTINRNFNDPKITVDIEHQEYDKFLELAEKI